MSLASPLARSRGSVAPQHRRVAPSGDRLKIDLSSTSPQPGVGEGMAQLVSVKTLYPSLLAAAGEHDWNPGVEPS